MRRGVGRTFNGKSLKKDHETQLSVKNEKYKMFCPEVGCGLPPTCTAKAFSSCILPGALGGGGVWRLSQDLPHPRSVLGL